MEEAETASILSRKELRKQKLMEYLAAKMKLKEPNSRPHPHNLDTLVKKPAMPAPKVVAGKENKAPAARVGHVNKKSAAVAPHSKLHPARREPGDNPKGNVPTVRQNVNCPPVPVGKALQKRNPVSSTSIRNPAKQPSSDRGPSSRFTSSANTTWSRPAGTVNDRMSLAPMVKTKTGLVPALLQPRISQNLTRGSTAVTDSTATSAHSAATKVRSSAAFPVVKTSATAQRKTLPATGLTRPTVPSSTARAGSKLQDEDKSYTKPLLNKQNTKPTSNGLRSTSSLSTSTAASVKPMGRVGAVPPRTVKSAGPPTDRGLTLRSEGVKGKNSQTRKTVTGASSATASRCSSRATETKTESKKGQSAVKAPQPQMGMKRVGPPAVSQTAPQPCRTVSFTGQAAAGKTTKAPTRVPPQTEPKKMTAAQEERMRKLREWREAKGISYKRPPMPVKTRVRRTVAGHQPFWVTMKQEDDANALISAVDRSLADCIKLLEESCPADQVKEVLSRLPPVSQKFAKYWICQARLMEQEGNLDVLPMFEEAVGIVLEPVDELRTVVFDILKKKDDIEASQKKREAEDEVAQTPTGGNTPRTPDSPAMTPKPVRALICGERGGSSVVKYKITATPGGHPSQPTTPAQVNGQEVRFFTPVRRSVRIERASLRYPLSLKDHDLCVASYDELISEEEKDQGEELNSGESSPSADATPMYIYRQNEALRDKVLVQLAYDDDV